MSRVVSKKVLIASRANSEPRFTGIPTAPKNLAAPAAKIEMKVLEKKEVINQVDDPFAAPVVAAPVAPASAAPAADQNGEKK